MKLKPKNWAVFQHYTNRMPPWIKFHRNLLIDREYMCLPIASKAIAPLLWLLASEGQDGVFDASVDELKFRLHLTEKEIESGLKPLIDKGFFYDASKTLAESLQDACLEGEKEKEEDRKKEAEEKKKVGERPLDVSVEVWEEFVSHRKAKKAKVTQLVIDGIVKEAKKAGWHIEDALKEVIIRNWQSFKAEFVKDKSMAYGGFTGPNGQYETHAQKAHREKVENVMGINTSSKPMLTVRPDMTVFALPNEKE